MFAVQPDVFEFVFCHKCLVAPWVGVSEMLGFRYYKRPSKSNQRNAARFVGFAKLRNAGCNLPAGEYNSAGSRYSGHSASFAKLQESESVKRGACGPGRGTDLLDWSFEFSGNAILRSNQIFQSTQKNSWIAGGGRPSHQLLPFGRFVGILVKWRGVTLRWRVVLC